jgi:tetratricopeptide (TPR) repeat protein
VTSARAPRRAPPGAAAFVAATLVTGCSAVPTKPPGVPERVELAGVPFHAQREYECGPASLAMLLNAAGVDVGADELVPQVYLPARRGSLQVELVAATRRHGRVPYVPAANAESLYAELAAGRPAIVLQNFGSAGWPQWHYAVAIGYEPGHVILRSGETERLRLRESRFLGTWERGGAWALVALRPGELPAGDDARRYLETAAVFERDARPEDAAAVFEAATRRWPDVAAAWLGLGNARVRLGDPAGAEAAFGAALERSPTDVAARNNLADLLARRGCVAAARVEIGRAARDAAGTSLAAAVERTRAEIEASVVPPASGRTCPAP